MHRLDAGNRLPLCEGEVDFICQDVDDKIFVSVLIEERAGDRCRAFDPLFKSLEICYSLLMC